jgi:hypothetical protein
MPTAEIGRWEFFVPEGWEGFYPVSTDALIKV